jgi:hypothetical protein
VLTEQGKPDAQVWSELETEFNAKIARLEEEFRTIAISNEPTVVAEGEFERLQQIAAHTVSDWYGHPVPLLDEQEVRLLSIRKGTLRDAERQQIESHVLHTYNFLKQIPWTPEITGIPDIAIGHHEKLNGTGYPQKLLAADIPLQTRMMTISDIFDALAAVDRPYKNAVSTERALNILETAVDDGEIDANLFQVFVGARVFEKWHTEPFPY